MKKIIISLIIGISISAINIGTIELPNIPNIVYANDPGDSNENNQFVTEKDIEVSINKDYDAIQFDVSFETDNGYELSLTTPEGNVVDGTASDKSGTIIVQDAKEGTYTVHVKTTVDVNSIDVTNYTADSEGKIDLVGKVTVSAKSVESINATDEGYSIAKELSGFKIYFKDNYLEIEWTDESAGNINVMVTDTATNQTIGQESCSEMKYELGLNKEVQQIVVDVTPAQAQNVEGAGNQYILDVPDKPSNTVTFDSAEQINSDTIKVSIDSEDTYSYICYVNGEEALKEQKNVPAGTTEYDIPVEEGINNITFYTIDSDGNMFSTEKTVTKDTIAPTLGIDSNIDGTATEDETVVVSGKVEDYSKLEINGETVEPDWEGLFSKEIELSIGENHILVTAYDEAGNTAVYDATITMNERTIPKIPFEAIFSILGIAGIFGFLYYSKKRKERDKALLEEYYRSHGGMDDLEDEENEKPKKKKNANSKHGA